MIGTKLHFQGETFIVPKVPLNYNDLGDILQSNFQLPNLWLVYSLNADGSKDLVSPPAFDRCVQDQITKDDPYLEFLVEGQDLPKDSNDFMNGLQNLLSGVDPKLKEESTQAFTQSQNENSKDQDQSEAKSTILSRLKALEERVFRMAANNLRDLTNPRGQDSQATRELVKSETEQGESRKKVERPHRNNNAHTTPMLPHPNETATELNGKRGFDSAFDNHSYEKTSKVVLITRDPRECRVVRYPVLQYPELSLNGLTVTDQDLQTKQKKPIHVTVRCDGCNVFPIIGIRYKCAECPDFDYCEACEENLEHPHVFLKIKEPNVRVTNVKNFEISWIDKIGEKTPSIIDTFKTFKRMIRAIKAGDKEKFNDYHQRIFGEFSEESKKLINAACSWCPERKDNLQQKWENLMNKNLEDQMSQLEIKDSKEEEGKPKNNDEDLDKLSEFIDTALSKLSIQSSDSVDEA